MHSQLTTSFMNVCRPVGAVFAALAAMLLAPPLGAQEDTEQVEVVKRPVVVVRNSTKPVHAWSVQGSRAFLGVQTVELTPELRQHFQVPSEVGIMIARITSDSPAEQCGLQVGDILTAVDGEPVSSSTELVRAIGESDVGSSTLIEIWRNGKIQTVTANLVEREGPWVDIRQFHLGDHHGLHEVTEGELEDAIEIETVTFNMAIERLNQAMDSPEWHERVYRFKEHQGDLMKRIETLEQRLKELEAELESLPSED